MDPHWRRIWLDVSALRRSPAQPTGTPRLIHRLAREVLHIEPAARLCVVDEHCGLCEVSPSAIFRRFEEPVADEPPRPPLGLRIRGRLRSLCNLPAPLTQIRDLGPRDLLVSLGGGWTADPGARLYRRLRRRTGVRLALVLCDLIPVRFPHYFPPIVEPIFRPWLRGMARRLDLCLAISQQTRRDFAEYCGAAGIATPPTEVLRLGDDFGAVDDGAWPRSLPAGRPFALSVGTLEIRKNHEMLYRVWRRLLAVHGPERVPFLVLAGSRGWLTDDLLRRIAADVSVHEHIRLLHAVDDAELARLYGRCLLTLYPSHYEGWGLPVCESLARGKVTIASSAASIPEVAPELTELCDPDDDASWKATIARFAFQESARQRREAAIRASYRPTSWADTANAIVQHLTASHMQSPV